MKVIILTLLVGVATGAFKDDCLNRHNALRMLHQNTPMMTYSDTVAQTAQAYADDLASRDAFEHSYTSGLGENLYKSSSSRAITGDHCNAATQAWYDEIKDYSYANPGFSMATGHFTQVVWVGTLEVGCGETKYQAPNGWFSTVVVCQYKKPGNYMGKFGSNVPPTKPTAFVSRVDPHHGSLNGETRITIHGDGFAKNQFSFGDGMDHVGNTVTLVSGKSSYPCRIHKDGCTEKQIMCYTPQLAFDNYYVRVAIDGKMISDDKLCNGNPDHYNCLFQPHIRHTPTLQTISPRSGPPGTIVTMYGKLYTDLYGSNQEKSSNDNSADIKRVYFGGQKCELKVPDTESNSLTDELYGLALDEGSDYGTLKCKMEGTYIGSLNASAIVSTPYGRTQADLDMLHITFNNKIAMFQTYAEVTGVSPSSGSTSGGTRITITGRHFDETNAPAVVDISGSHCEVESLSDTSIVCITGPRPSDQTMYPGNRGINKEMWNSTTVSFNELEEVMNYTENNPPNYSIEWMDEAAFKDTSDIDNFVTRLRGFFVPPVDSEYMFYIKSDDTSRLYLSQSADPENKTEVAYCDGARSSYAMPSQMSEREAMEAGKKYYVEVVQQEGNGDASLSVAVKMFTTKFTSQESGDVDTERQTVFTTSTIVKEQQSVELENWSSQSSTNEVQRVTVNAVSGAIRLGMDGVYTGLIDISDPDSATLMADELSKLPTVSPATVLVTVNPSGSSIEFVVTFTSTRGYWPALTYKGADGTANMVVIKELTKGVPSLETFQLEFDGVPTVPLAIDASENDVESAINDLFSYRCPEEIIKPSNKYYFEDYESNSFVSGTKDTTEQPFCGRSSVKNPNKVFEDFNDPISLSQHKYMCVAYKGDWRNLIRLDYNYVDADRKEQSGSVFIDHEMYADGETDRDSWQYTCVDLYSNVFAAHPTGSFFEGTRVRLLRNSDAWADVVYIGKKPLVQTSQFPEITLLAENIPDQIVAPPTPGGQMIDSVTLSKSGNQMNITMNALECSHNFPLFSVRGGNVQSGSKASGSASARFGSSGWGSAKATTTRLASATPPIGGHFTLTFKGESVQVPAGATGDEFKDIFQTMSSSGLLELWRSGTCSGYSWSVSFLSNTGDQETIQLDGSTLTGNEVSVNVHTNTDGGVFLNPVQGDWLRTAHAIPQVSVEINNIPSACSGQCSFEYTDANTPSINGTTPQEGSASDGTELVIFGTSFDSNMNNNMVNVGGVPCQVTAATANQITCDIGIGPAGSADIVVTVDGQGNALHTGGPFTFTYVAYVTDIEPNTGSVAGGTKIVLIGTGLGPQATVTIGGNPCEIISRNYTHIECISPPGDSAGSVEVQVSQLSGVITSSTNFAYDQAVTPTISSISASSGSVQGGESIDISGSMFGASPVDDNAVQVAGIAATIESWSDTAISVILPALPPGTHPLVVAVGQEGFADTRANNIPDISVTLEVTDVSPLVGSKNGGTKVTITGQGFMDGTPKKVTIGDTDCSIITESTTEIVCEIGTPGTDHFVTNNGVHSIHGKGYAWEPQIVDIQEGDTVNWQWAAPALVKNVGYLVNQTVNSTAKEYDGSGFTSGAVRTAQGSFKHQFNAAGTYYYWSDYVDLAFSVFLRGTIRVTERTAFNGPVSVKVNNFEATYTMGGAAGRRKRDACAALSNTIDGCTNSGVSSNNSVGFEFEFTECSTATVTSVSPNSGTSYTSITITGTGFGPEICQNDIMIGSQPCTISAASETSLTCNLDHGAVQQVGMAYPVTVTVNNRGEAANMIGATLDRSFALLPEVTSVSPSSGSTAGGTVVTISGSGFSAAFEDTSVSINGIDCVVDDVTYTTVSCITRASIETSGDVVVAVGQFMSTCEGTCTYAYSNADTPTVSSISPITVSGSSTIVSIGGTNFGSNSSAVQITAGMHECTITDITDTSITCDFGYVTVGEQSISINIVDKGKAVTSVSSLTSEAVVDSLSPNQGSVNGGTLITIQGNGFDDSNTLVTIDGAECELVTVTLSQITCTTGANVDGAAKVNIVSNSVTYPEQDFTYSDAITPVVSSVNPTSGGTGDDITIAGTGFSSSTSDVSVMIGTASCSVTASSTTSITCTLGSSPSGSYTVDVAIDGVGIASTSTSFTYTLRIDSISPTSGSLGGGQPVTVSGVGFEPSDTQVTICGEACIVDNDASTSSDILCVTPSNSGIGTVTCDVVLSSGLSNDTLSSGYTYDSSMTPAVTSVSPARGGTGGGLSITIAGSGFGSIVGDVNVTIDGTVCAVSSVEDTAIVCVTGAHSSSIKTKARVEIGTSGIATQDGADFWYIDVYSSPYTWGGNDPPVEGDFIVVPDSMTLLIDVDTPILSFLLIQGGTVMFDDSKDIHLQANNILIVGGGSLQVGTESEPYQHKGIITMHGHLRSLEFPIYGTKTIAVREGTIELHGKPVTPTWTHLGSTAAAGATSITLNEAVSGWNVGDEIVIATTGGRHSQKETEKRTITAISGTTLTLDTALVYEHLGVSETFSDGTTVQFRAEVGLLTRNVVVKGSRDMQWADEIEACPDGFDTGEFATQTCFQGRFGEEIGSDQFGATIMLHAPEKDQDIVAGHISYAEVTYAGQAFRLGRYPIHFHLNGDMSGSYVKGCAIHETFNRAVNIHGSHNIQIQDNVVYNVMGGALFLEDGVETGNVFDHNIVVFCKQSTSLLNDDITPAAFWCTNANNTYTRNTAVGGTHFGFWFRMHDHPDGPSFDENICPKHSPLGLFDDNTVHSQGWFGLWIFMEWYPMKGGGCDATEAEPAVFKRLTAWNCEKGAEAVSVGAIQFDEAVVVNNDKAGLEYKMTKNALKYHPDGCLVNNSVIIAEATSSDWISCTKKGMILPWDAGFIIANTKFVNFKSGSCTAFAATRIDGTCILECGGWDYIAYGLEFFDSPNKALFEWPHEYMIRDLDGSLTGTVGATVSPSNPSLPPSCSEDSAFSIGSVPGSVCSDPNTKFVRFSWNHAVPDSLEARDVLFTNQYGTTRVNYLKKRLTHKLGWMVSLLSGERYNMLFEHAGHLVNITYDGKFYGLMNDEYVIIEHNFTQAPDRFSLNGLLDRNVTAEELSYSNDNVYDYHFDKTTNDFTYLISGKSQSKRAAIVDGAIDYYGSEFEVKPKVYRCYYEDCIPPVDPASIPPASRRPDDYQVWSDSAYWAGSSSRRRRAAPTEGDDVLIRADTWVVADVELPYMHKLTISGTLELEYLPDPETGKVRDFTLNATYIFITGRFIVGWPDTPYTGLCQIILNGNHNTPDMPLPDGPNMGSKVLGAFGGLDMYGIDRDVVWTKLASTASVGDNTITLIEPVDWVAGEQIVIAPTALDPWETETFSIVSVSEDKLSLTLNDTLAYRHTGETETYGTYTVSMAAEVGLLTRNIRIIGADYDKLYQQSFGARVIVGTFRQDGTFYTGYARLSNVEFYHTGQEGYVEGYDPRYSLAFLDTGANTELKPSFISKCSFHTGFSPAIGLFGATGIPVTDNVIHHTVGQGMRIAGSGHEVRRNFLSLMIWPGSYQDRSEGFNYNYEASIEVQDGVDIVLEGNHVAGSERVGFHIDGESCSGSSIEAWSNNVAHSCMFGVFMNKETLPSSMASCLKISGFDLWMSYDYGIYIQQGIKETRIENVRLLDNQLSLIMINNGPKALSHVAEDKVYKISNSLFVGTSAAYDCNIKKQNDDNTKNSGAARTGIRSGHRVGFFWPSFLSTHNAGPKMPYPGMTSYPAIAGLVTVDSVTFANFGDNQCGGKDVVIMTNPSNVDGMHPVRTSNIELVNVAEKGKAFLGRPLLSHIDPSNCVDMECDGKKKAILDDLDGTFLGSIGTIIPESEWAWDGDRARGIGDHRIPKAYLTMVDGTRLLPEDVCPNKGIIRDASCVLNDDWQAYECHGLDYEMMVIESMDKDTEMRRLSPIALVGDKYVDLINGPEDHGWCFGYTCQKRISTFYSIVATGKHYDLYFSSTTPQNLRLHLLNSVESQTVRTAIFYKAPFRLDVYVDGVYIPPLNHDYNDDGDMILKAPTTFDEYHPDIENGQAGDNYVDRDSREIYLLIRGSTPITIKQTSVLYVSFNSPAITVDDFFGENLVSNLASLLKIDPSKIKVMEVVSANSGRKRRSLFNKRSTDGSTITLEIGESPSTTFTNTTEPGALTSADLAAASATIVDCVQLGTIGELLNTTITDIVIYEPVPDVSDPSWETFVDNEEVGSGVSYQKPETLQYSTPMEILYEGIPFLTAPSFNLLGASGNVLSAVGSFHNPWEMTATLILGQGSHPSATLTGNTTVQFSAGQANFSDIGVSHGGSGYQILFAVTNPAEGTGFNMTTSAFSVPITPLSANVACSGSMLSAGGDMGLSVEIIHGVTKLKHEDIAWRGHTWSASASLNSLTSNVGVLSGVDTVTIDPSTGSGQFSLSMAPTSPMRVLIDVHVTSNPADYDFVVTSAAMDIMPSSYTPVTVDTTKAVQLFFDADYDAIVLNKESMFIANMYNYFVPKYYTNATLGSWAVTKGSIILAFSVNGYGPDVDSVLSDIYDEISKDLVLSFDGSDIVARKEMTVDGDEYLGEAGPIDAPNSNMVIIIAAAAGSVAVVAIVIIIIIVIMMKGKKSKFGSTGRISPESMDDLKHLKNNRSSPTYPTPPVTPRPSSSGNVGSDGMSRPWYMPRDSVINQQDLEQITASDVANDSKWKKANRKLGPVLAPRQKAFTGMGALNTLYDHKDEDLNIDL